jgi:hypothetical protein
MLEGDFKNKLELLTQVTDDGINALLSIIGIMKFILSFAKNVLLFSKTHYYLLHVKNLYLSYYYRKHFD